MEKFVKSPLIKFFSFVEDNFFYVSLFITFFTAVFISLGALLRYFFDKPIPAGFEISEEYLMPAIFFLAVSAIYTRGGHVRVTLFLRYIPSSIQKVIQVFFNLLCLGYSILLAYGGAIITYNAIINKEYSISILAYPLAPAYAFVLIGFSLLSIRLTISLFDKETSSESVKN